MPRLSLRLKFLISLGLVLLPMLALLLYTHNAWYSSRRAGVLGSQVQTAGTIAALVDATFDRGLAVAQALSVNPIVQTLDPSVLGPWTAALGRVYPQYDNISVFDAGGNDVGSIHMVEGGTRPNVSDRMYFRQAMATNDVAISDVIVSRATGNRVVVLAVPIRNSQGKPMGVVATVLDLSVLAQRLVGESLQPEQTIYLTDRKGVLAVHTALPLAAGELRDVSDYPPIQAALRGDVYRSENSKSLVGDVRVTAALPSPKYGWPVGASIPQNVALAPLDETLRRVLIAFGIVALLTLALILLLSSMLLGPVRQLERTAMALGRGNFGSRARIHTGDELEQLGNSLDFMADEVERMMRLRDEFLATAAHELKTPVTTIKGYAQLMQQWTPGGHDAREGQAVAVITRQCDRLATRIQEMLEAARFRVGGLEMHKERFDLADVAQQVINRMQLTADRYRFTLTRNGITDVEADRERIEEVLVNLVDNAIKFSPEGSEVAVTVESRDDQVVASIADQGVGIPRDRWEHVFEPFYDPVPSGAPGYWGVVGLGLFLSKHIAEQHGGRVWFTSIPGAGSTFSFSLPAISIGSELPSGSA